MGKMRKKKSRRDEGNWNLDNNPDYLQSNYSSFFFLRYLFVHVPTQCVTFGVVLLVHFVPSYITCVRLIGYVILLLMLVIKSVIFPPG